MYIRFKRVAWKNFLSTGDVFTEIQLDRSHTTLIVGENGAGKSTILDAISFALFGKPFRNVKKDQLINSINNGKTVVEIEFDIGDKQYHIKRGIKPALFEIYQNGTLIDQNAAVREYQEYLETNILKMNQKSFSQIVVIGSASYIPFMQLTAGHRREVIEDLLELEIFSTMNTLLKDRITDNKQSIQGVDYDIMSAQQYIKLVEENMETINRYNESSIKGYEEKIDAETVKLREMYDRQTAEKMQIVEIQQTHIDRSKHEAAARKISKIISEQNIIIANANRDIEFFENHDSCPTCKQNIAHNFLNSTLYDKRKEVKSAVAEIEKCNRVMDKLDPFLGRYIEDDNLIASLEASIHNAEYEMKSIVKIIRGYKDEIDKIKNRSSDPVSELQAESKKRELAELLELKERLLREKDTLEVAALLLKDGGIKAKIIKQYIPIINKLINKYLASMDFFVQFELDENFNETIKSRFRDEFSYASFSEGEKTRIDLALLFTWRTIAKMRNSTTTNLLILDEIFDGALDSGGTDEFLKIINTIDGDNNTFVISHKTDQMYDKFHSIIKFEKYKSFSRIAP